MKTNIFIVLLLLYSALIYSQSDTLTETEIFGKWVVAPDYPSTEKVYLIDPEVCINPNKIGVEFFLGEYTGKKKIRYFEKRVDNVPQRRCSNYKPYNPARIIGAQQAIWQYNSATGILEIIHPRFLKSTFFKIEKQSSSKLLLTRI